MTVYRIKQTQNNMHKTVKKIAQVLAFMVLVILFVQCNNKEVTGPRISEFETQFTSGKAFLTSKAPVKQQFTKDASNFFQITSQNGFTYAFSAGSLIQNGNPVSGNVEVAITEYTRKSDMIFSGITTLAGDQLLTSGGMFNIEISANNLPVELNGIYQVSIPTQNIDPRMEVFEGREVTNADKSMGVNWVTADSSWLDPDRDTINREDSGRYYLNLDFLSWCNLDKYINAPEGGQVRLKLPKEFTNSNTTVYMIFEENSVVNLFADATLEEFNSGNFILPLGWNIKLLAVCVDTNKDLQYALIDSKITDPHLETVTAMTKISESDLETLIKAL